MKRIMLVLVVAMSLLSGACAMLPLPAPKVGELEVADYGVRPENVDAAVSEWMKGYFNDPFSAVAEYTGELKKGWWYLRSEGDPLLMGFGATRILKFGWVLPVRVNAKNSLGAFTGFKAYELYFQGDKVVAWK